MKLRHLLTVCNVLLLFVIIEIWSSDQWRAAVTKGWHSLEDLKPAEFKVPLKKFKVPLKMKTFTKPILVSHLEPSRVRSGIQVLYDFQEQDGTTIRDRSGVGPPLDLLIDKPETARCHEGKLMIDRPGLIRSSKPATKLTKAVKQSGEITIEAWLKPKSDSQTGPARIISLSPNPNERNFTLGQDRNQFDVRMRSTGTDKNGMPSVASTSGSLKTEITHVVYTRDKSGLARLFINGKQNASRKVSGNLSNWNDNYHLCLANEASKDRPWLGELHLVAIYSRTLSTSEVEKNYTAGIKSQPVQNLITQSVPKEKAVNLARIRLPGGRIMADVDFERHVMGIFSREGCNTGSCHGSFQGDSDLQLSLFGHDPSIDYTALTDNTYGPFFNLKTPEKSDVLRKPTGLTKHKGGKRFGKNDWEYEVLRNWILSGAGHETGSGKVTSISVSPSRYRFSSPGKKVSLKVEAAFADGSSEDVTAFCRFETQDDFIAEVSEDGRVKGLNPGDTAIVVSYRDEVIASRALISVPVGFVEMARDWISGPAKITESNYIDREVFTKLAALKIEPSDRADDEEFLRRVYIDTISQLPSPDDTKAFLEDKNPEKRSKKVDELLSHPLHAALWATKFSDITGNDTNALEQPREKRSKMWHDWLRDRFAKNVPYDQIVLGVLVATSREGKNTEQWIREARLMDEGALGGFNNNYAKRDTLDLFWARRNLSLEHMAEQTASAFLGVQLACAQCHKHPYDQWTQADYRAYANIFGQVKNGTSPEGKKVVGNENNRRKKIKDKKKRLPTLREVYLDGKPRQLKHPETNQPLPPTALGGPELSQKGDYRVALFDWMIKPDNPFFARALVNRVWAHYMGIGIVEPVDGMSAANPPSNPQLLDALAEDFIEHHFDIRHLEKQILGSKTYQLSSHPTETNKADKINYARKYPRRMMAESVVDVINSALGTSDEFTRDAPKGSSAIEVAGSKVNDGNLSYIFNVFGRPPRTSVCDCDRSLEPALPQTLYLMTDSRVQDKIRKGRLKRLLDENGRLDKLKKKKLGDPDLNAVVDELFLATLTRYPDEIEREAAIQNVRQQDGSEAGLVDIVWALINTREFILNH